MPYCLYNIPSEQATPSRRPPHTPAHTATMTGGGLNIACYISNIARYIVITVARTAKMAGGDTNIACYKLIIASRTINIASHTININHNRQGTK